MILILLALCFIGTIKRNRVWHSAITLWEDTVRKSPHKSRPHLQLGDAYVEAKRLEDARKQYEIVLTLPDRDRRPVFDGDRYEDGALSNIAYIDILEGKREEAIAILEELLSGPNPPDAALGNAAQLLLQYSNPTDALIQLNRVRHPNPQTWYNSAEAYRLLNDCTKAVPLYSEAARWGFPSHACP